MRPNLFKKNLSPRNDKVLQRHPMTLGHRLSLQAITACVALLIIGSLWVAGDAMFEKLRTARGTAQIVDIVELSRRLSNMDRDLGAVEREDLIKRLAHSKQVEDVHESDGLATIANPWGGDIVAYTVPNDLFRLETAVPPRACMRILNILTQSMTLPELKKIDARGRNGAGRQIFDASSQSRLDKTGIAAGCQSNDNLMLILTFALR